ncbi:hypothetical protein NCCNTM_02270 [Mycolicibacterium sp. NCC-Tsukiji]|nr:hypothetical protein NCCNTM_02270 [Mycolicibacterium sp. NCC-Tsukiji]
MAPTFCLGLYPDDTQRCALPRDRALNQAVRRAETDLAARSTFDYLDYSGYLCNDTVCPSIIGDTLVYRDGHHLTVNMSAALAPIIGADVLSLLTPEGKPATADTPARGLHPHRD